VALIDRCGPRVCIAPAKTNVDLIGRRGAILIPLRPFSESHRPRIQPMAGASFKGRSPLLRPPAAMHALFKGRGVAPRAHFARRRCPRHSGLPLPI
jgi:hypothetical protein